MNEINEGMHIPADIPQTRHEILAAAAEKDYPRDLNFAETFAIALADLLRGLGELLFGGASPAPEHIYISDVNESMEREIAEIINDVFSKDVIERWPAMDSTERQAYAEEYYSRLAIAMGLEPTEFVFNDLNPGYQPGISTSFTFGGHVERVDGSDYIELDFRLYDNPENLMKMISTTTHEARHQYQFDVVNNPEKYADILPQRTIDAFIWNWHNYFNSSMYGPELYYYQALEVDAESFAQNIMSEYDSIANNK